MKRLRKLFDNQKLQPLNKFQWLTFLVAMSGFMLLLPTRLDTSALPLYYWMILPVMLTAIGIGMAIVRGYVWYLPILSVGFFALTASGLSLMTLGVYSLLYLMFGYLGLTIGYVVYRIKQPRS